MLTIDDLADRWGVSPADARRIVREGKVPHVALRKPSPGAMRICWRFARFEPEAVAAWEAGRRMAYKPRRAPTPQPADFGPPILRRR